MGKGRKLGSREWGGVEKNQDGEEGRMKQW